METTVGKIAGGDRFSIYGQMFLKIDRDNPECYFVGYSEKGKPHGYAVCLTRGLIVNFPVSTRCRFEDSDDSELDATDTIAGMTNEQLAS